MTFGLNHIIAPQPVGISVQSKTVADVLATIGLLPRQGGDERHIGINEWVDRVRLSLSEDLLYNTTLVIWGLGIEGLLNAVDDPTVFDDFSAYLQKLSNVNPEKFRDTCLHWFINSAYRRVLTEATPFETVDMSDLLEDRAFFIDYVHRNVKKNYLEDATVAMVDLYLNPQQTHQLALQVLTDLWETYFCDEWTRHQRDIQRVEEAFKHVDTTNVPTFEAIQMITGRDLRPVFRPTELSQFEQLIFVPSTHNGPYVVWFGNDTTLYVIFTARMPAEVHTTDKIDKPDINVLIQRFKALSDDNRVTVLLAIREHGELSTQDIIEQFDLNKSAASRYLGQLLANGFILERRDTDGKTKFYSINDDVIDEFLQSIAHLLKS